jgi:hypothetical protein
MKHTTQYLILVISFVSFACNGNKDQGDYNRGYTAGYTAGKADNKEKAKASELKKCYEKGFQDGLKQGRFESSITESIKTPVVVPLQDLERLVLKVYYKAGKEIGDYGIAADSDPKSIGDFIEQHHHHTSPKEENGRFGYFTVSDVKPIDDGNQCLVILRDYWRINYVPHIIALFDSADDLLVLQGFLDETYGESIGGVGLKELIKLSDASYLLVFWSGGGDAGDSWGSTWFSYWEKPFALKELYNKSYEIQQVQPDSIYIEKVIDYSLTDDSMVAHVVLKERKRYYPPNVSRTYNNSKTTEWVVLDSDTVDLVKLIKWFDPDFKSLD